MPEYLIIPGPMPTVRMIGDSRKSASPENPPQLGDVSSSGIGVSAVIPMTPVTCPPTTKLSNNRVLSDERAQVPFPG